MAKYLWRGSYTTEGSKTVLQDGGKKRVQAVEHTVAGLGGKVDAFYFGFGADDFYVVVELPDNATAASASLNMRASGAASIETIALLTPEEVDLAATKIVI